MQFVTGGCLLSKNQLQDFIALTQQQVALPKYGRAKNSDSSNFQILLNVRYLEYFYTSPTLSLVLKSIKHLKSSTASLLVSFLKRQIVGAIQPRLLTHRKELITAHREAQQPSGLRERERETLGTQPLNGICQVRFQLYQNGCLCLLRTGPFPEWSQKPEPRTSARMRTSS